jgi:hypothetical protein
MISAAMQENALARADRTAQENNDKGHPHERVSKSTLGSHILRDSCYK